MSEAARSAFEALLDRVERERGLACASYKHSCLERRIRTRMRAKGADSYDSYLRLLDSEPREMDRLVDALTVNVTRFFRNPTAWDLLAEQVVPTLWSSELNNIRVWSAGCASGEEALSVAMLFHRHAAINGMLSQIGRVTVTGSDVDEGALRLASRGGYSSHELVHVPQEFRTRYFSEEEPHRPSPGIQRMVRYVRHDLLKDPYPTSPQHLIICRNVLIYFDRAVQQRVIEGLRDSLAPGGFLVLGKVESLLGAAWSFQRVAPRERIFRKLS